MATKLVFSRRSQEGDVHVEVVDSSFEPWQYLQRYEAQWDESMRAKFGACAVFLGSMRDFNAGTSVTAMTLEHYPGMTERVLAEIARVEQRRSGFSEALIVHRVGLIKPSEHIVLVAVWSAQRGAAFDSCRAIMEELKQRAPFWKCEHGAEGSRWVASNSDGYSGAG